MVLLLLLFLDVNIINNIHQEIMSIDYYAREERFNIYMNRTDYIYSMAII